MVHADATDNSEPVYGVTINGGSGDASVAIPEDALPLGEYRLFAASYDVNGNTIAQDLSDIFAVVEELPEPEAPVNPGHVAGDGTPITLPDPEKPGAATPPATDAPVAEQGDTTSDAETPALDGGDAERVPSTQPGNEEVGEAVDESTGFIEAVKKFLQSPNAPAVISGAFASVIGLIIVALIYQAYREWRQAQWLLAVIKRDQQTVADKDAFLRLAAHYLRTPMSLIDSGASLLQRLQGDESSRLLAAALEGISHSMRGKIELILGQTLDANELTTITAQTTGQARLKIAASPIFWAPVIASVLLTVVANTIIVTYGGQMLAGQQVLQQFFILAFAGIVLYMAARFVAMRRERTEKLKASQSKIRILNTAKMAFVQRTYEGLSDDVLHLSGYDVSSVQNDVVRQAIDDGATRLKELVSRFAVLSSIRPEYIRSKPFSVEELVSESLREVPDAIRTSLRIDNKASDLRLVQDERFLGKVITTIFETISSDTSLNSVTIEGAKKKSGVTTLTLTSQLNGALGAPGEELFSIYSSEGNEEAATYSSDESKHRLDLYLDRMIMSQLGGDIKTRHSDRSFQVQLTIPSGVS